MREAVGLSQELLAYRSGVSVATVRRAEQGDMPRVVTLEKMALVLGVPIDRLIAAIRVSGSGAGDDEPAAATG